MAPKARGELAEIAFLYAAAQQGLVVAKPWGDNQPFDFLVGAGKRFHRVQVKSASVPQGRGFHLSCFRPGDRKGYTAEQIDFLAAYVVPEDAWFIIPVRALGGRKTIVLFPGHSSGLFHRYRDRWSFLQRRR